jgi:hypothetical protein
MDSLIPTTEKFRGGVKNSELLLNHKTYRLRQKHLTSAIYLSTKVKATTCCTHHHNRYQSFIISSANYTDSRLVENFGTKSQRKLSRFQTRRAYRLH